MRLSVEEVPATPAMASMLMVIHLMQRSVLRRPDTETCAVRSAHASREVLDRSLSCGRSVDAIGAPQRLRCQLPHIGASGAPAASNEACWCATATPTGQSKPTVRETPFFHTVLGFATPFGSTSARHQPPPPPLPAPLPYMHHVPACLGVHFPSNRWLLFGQLIEVFLQCVLPSPAFTTPRTTKVNGSRVMSLSSPSKMSGDPFVQVGTGFVCTMAATHW